MREEAAEPLPDHLRCKRTDGRQWRCRRRVLDDKKLCEIHYLQGKHRQNKEKVPESLKLERSRGRPRGKGPVMSKLKIRAQKMKKRKLGKELMRMLVEREAEKRREAQQSEAVGEGVDKEEEAVDMMRRLPHGVMVISQSPVGKKNDGLNDRNGGNVGSLHDVKVGENGVVSFGSRRRFRSKNLEPLPLGMVQILPCKRILGNEISRKRCHWCNRGNSSNLTKCSACKKLFYCIDCIKERYHDTREEVKRKCPVCRQTCRCSECSTDKFPEVHQEPSSLEIRADKILCSHYLISTLLPVIKKINQEKSIELEVEAKLRGMDISKVQIQLAECGAKERCCNICKIPILDLHRSCSNCSYSLCLSCYWDSQRGISSGELKMHNKSVKESKIFLAGCTQSCEESIIKRKRGQKFGGRVLSVPFSLTNSKSRWNHGVRYCPRQELGGCGSGLLCLQSMFPSQLMTQLETNAEEIACSYDFLEGSDGSLPCPFCPVLDHNVRSKELQEAASRRNSNDNFLYFPTSLEIRSDKREHFQKHWGRGHPVIVRNVLKRTSELSWDPVNLFCAYLEGISTREKLEEKPKGRHCLEWCEVDICANQVFVGSLRGQALKNISHEMLKMKGWLSSSLLREHFSAHYADIVQALPLQEYMNPSSGPLNLTTGRPAETFSADFGPYVHILYSNAEDHEAPTVSKLCYDLCDMVYLLASTSDELISLEKIKKIKKLMRKRQALGEEDLMTVSSDEVDSVGINEERSCLNENASEELEKVEEMRVRKRMARLCSLSSASDELYRPMCYNRYSLHGDANDLCNGFGSSYVMSVGCNDGIQDSKSCGVGLKNFKFSRKQLEKSGGAQWDVFRREDAPKIIEYLKRHSYNSIQSYDPQEHLVHPIFDQCFFLDAIQKMRLKEEFDVEPWTFEQQVGEAVIIPAGCPYQIKNPKSCVNVVLHFISPESVGECIHLIDEIRRLPEDHEARADGLEVKRMAIDSISRAIQDIRELTLSTNKRSSK